LYRQKILHLEKIWPKFSQSVPAGSQLFLHVDEERVYILVRNKQNEWIFSNCHNLKDTPEEGINLYLAVQSRVPDLKMRQLVSLFKNNWSTEYKFSLMRGLNLASREDVEKLARFINNIRNDEMRQIVAAKLVKIYEKFTKINVFRFTRETMIDTLIDFYRQIEAIAGDNPDTWNNAFDVFYEFCFRLSTKDNSIFSLDYDDTLIKFIALIEDNLESSEKLQQVLKPETGAPIFLLFPFVSYDIYGLSEEEKELFNAKGIPCQRSEKIRAGFFEEIEIEKIGENIWEVSTEKADAAVSNVGRTLLSVIRKIEPRYRFGEGPSLKFKSELGNVVLNKDGFLVQSLAVAKFVDRAGIKQGDLIKNINGYSVNSLFGLYKAYMVVKSDKNVKIVNVDIIRDGKPETLVYKIR